MEGTGQQEGGSTLALGRNLPGRPAGRPTRTVMQER
jgi:hypothetical protein